jgi:hypothetical protein
MAPYLVFVDPVPRNWSHTLFSPLVTIKDDDDKPLVSMTTSLEFDNATDAQKWGMKLAESWIKRRSAN